MSSHSESLLKVMEEMYGQYCTLENLLKEEKLALLKNSLNEIEECASKKEGIAQRLSALELKREGLISSISVEKSRSKSDIDLTLLSKDPDPLLGGGFGRMKSNLTPLLKRVDHLNIENRYFIQEAMNGVASTFSFFNRITSDKKTYRGSGGYATQRSGTAGKVLYRQI